MPRDATYFYTDEVKNTKSPSSENTELYNCEVPERSVCQRMPGREIASFEEVDNLGTVGNIAKTGRTSARAVAAM